MLYYIPIVHIFFPLCSFICIGVLPACTSRHHLCAWYLRKPDQGTGSLRTGVKTVWTTLYVLGTNLSPLEEQPALLSMEPSLQTLSVYFKSSKKHYCFVELVYLYIPPQIFVFLWTLFPPPSSFPSHLRPLSDSQNGHALYFLCGVSKFSKTAWKWFWVLFFLT